MSQVGGHANICNLDEGVLQWLVGRGTKTFIDVGCGTGGMVNAAKLLGMNALGIEGDSSVQKECEDVIIHDLDNDIIPENVKREWDCMYTCEVLEHISPDIFDRTVSQIVERSKMIVMTCAPPGWGGFHHVNEQEHRYWIEKFDKLGYRYDYDLTVECRNRSTMNLHRNVRKQFMKHRGLVFVRKSGEEKIASYRENVDKTFMATKPSGTYYRKTPVVAYA